MLFSQVCILCAAGDCGSSGLCLNCSDSLPWHHTPCCPQCALPSSGKVHCGRCIASSPDFDITHALFRYEYPIDAMLQRFKYGQNLTMAHTLAALFVDAIKSAARPDVIIPMPLHPQRLQTRGFNQSLEIGRILAKKLGIRLDYQSCVRTKLTPPQTSLPLKIRVKNMQGAFRCDDRLDGLRVALLDDVMTTGASLNALAKAVKKAGAVHVESWVVARTLPK